VQGVRLVVSYDGTDVTTAATVTSRYVEYDATGLANGSSHDLDVTVADDAGNTASETVSFTVASPPSSSSPSSSSPPSSGGSVVRTPTGPTTTTPSEPPEPSVRLTSLGDGRVGVTASHVRASEPVDLSFPAGDLAAGGVTFDGLVVTFPAAGDYNLSVSATASPTDAPPFDADGGSPLGYLSVTHAFGDGAVSGATLRVTVTAAALDASAATPDGVTLYRYHDGTWTPLSTRLVAVENGTDVFEADSPGLSWFVLAANGETTASTPTTSPTEASTPTTSSTTASTPTTSPTTTTTGSGSPGFGVGLAVLSLVLAALFVRRRRED